jgi:hypothetical protein
MQSFAPRINESFSIFLERLELRFEPMAHPGAANMVHSMRAGKSTVYRLRHVGGSGEYALKVMLARFRDPALEAVCNQLEALKKLSGLEVCDRRCLSPTHASDTVRRFPTLEYSILMPWINGTSWFDVHIGDPVGGRLTKLQCLHLATNFASTMAALERAGLAHCDLSPANLIFDPDPESLRVELIDVEEFYGPGFLQVRPQPIGTTGYQHKKSRQSGWQAMSDRFAGALLLSEMLAWHSEAVKQVSWGETYFEPAELQMPNSRRFDVLSVTLSDHHRELSDLLRRAWHSSDFADCPSFFEWEKTLKFVANSAPGSVTWVPKDYSTRRKPVRCWNGRPAEDFWKRD